MIDWHVDKMKHCMLFYYVGYSARTLGQNAIFTVIEINIVNSTNYWLHHFFDNPKSGLHHMVSCLNIVPFSAQLVVLSVAQQPKSKKTMIIVNTIYCIVAFRIF